MSNAPDVHELFVLPDGVDKVTAIDDTKLPNAVNFIIEKEGHTIGNLVRMQLLRDPNVIFGGYKVPHPLENHIEVKVQTNDNSTPNESMIACIKSLLRELDQIKESFNAQVAAEDDPNHQYQ
mmetsp:Transcript_28819/g.49199  ORF Transcript_28819/g.49199 Transcript_28819/m.49199 type:complete len:122 (+) Transcript_28819:24-389(+)